MNQPAIMNQPTKINQYTIMNQPTQVVWVGLTLNASVDERKWLKTAVAEKGTNRFVVWTVLQTWRKKPRQASGCTGGNHHQKLSVISGGRRLLSEVRKGRGRGEEGERKGEEGERKGRGRERKGRGKGERKGRGRGEERERKRVGIGTHHGCGYVI